MDGVVDALGFDTELRTGSSLPVVVRGSDNKRYVVKLAGSGQGVLATAVEWVAGKLGGLLSVPVLRPVLVRLSRDFYLQAADPETQAVLRRSAGLNFATPFVERAADFESRHLASMSVETRCRVFLYDVFLVNVDRNAANSNMLVSGGQLRCFDYSSSMVLRRLFSGESYDERAVLRQLKRHPFYSASYSTLDFVADAGCVDADALRELFDSMPDEWLRVMGYSDPGSARAACIRRMTRILRPGIHLRARYDLLKMLTPEPDDAAGERKRRNRLAFESKYGRIRNSEKKGRA